MIYRGRTILILIAVIAAVAVGGAIWASLSEPDPVTAKGFLGDGFVRGGGGGAGSSSIFDTVPDSTAIFYDDGFGLSNSASGTFGLISQNSGTAAQVVIVGDTGRPGLVRIEKGTTATGRAAWSLPNASNAVQFGVTDATFGWEAAIRIANASDGTDTYSLQCGFLDTVTAKTTGFGADLLYDTTVSPNWICETYDGTVTSTVTATAVAINTWIELRVEVESNTTARFYVDDVLVCTHTTDIPTGAAQATGFGVMMLGSVGIANRTVQIDYQIFRGVFPTPR